LTLIVRTPNWLGDLVMSLPAVAMLSARYPDMSIWSHERVSGLLPVFFPSLHVYGTGYLKGKNFTELLLLTGSFRSALQGFLSGIPERTGYSTDMRGPLLTQRIKPPQGRLRHHSEDYIDLAIAAGASDRTAVPEPILEPQGYPHVAYFTGARYGSAKIWPYFDTLSRMIHDSTGLPSVFYGSKEEHSALGELSSSVPVSEVITGLSLEAMVLRLAAAELTVGNDSGGVHVSALLGIPTVTIFGSTSPDWTSPNGPRTAVVVTDAECSPCFRRKCPSSTEPECLFGISADDVYSTCMELVNEPDVTDG
jgi:heptosyltransferase II